MISDRDQHRGRLEPAPAGVAGADEASGTSVPETAEGAVGPEAPDPGAAAAEYRKVLGCRTAAEHRPHEKSQETAHTAPGAGTRRPVERSERRIGDAPFSDP